jgi:probable phosphoglycerate mutase
MVLYIIRHGDPIYSTDSLTERGKLQAEAVAKRMQQAGINKIFTSPMGRARMTAEPTCRLLGLDYTVEDWSHEIEDERLTPFPDGKMKSVSLVQNTYYRENGNILLPYERAYECQGINGSKMNEIVPKIEAGGRDFLERLGYKEENGVYKILYPNEDRVALFCHSAMGRAWISTLLHIPLHIMWASFAYTHTGVTIIEFANNENGVTAPKCRCYSDMSHLFAAGLDMCHDNDIEV